MLRYGILHNLSVTGHCVEFYFLGILKEFGNHNREFLRHLCCLSQEAVHLLVIVTNIHGRTRKHIARTNQHRKSNLLDKRHNILLRSKFLPSGLVNAKLVEHGREFVTVFGTVNRHRRCSQNRHMAAVELHCQVVRDLAPHAHNNTARRFQVYYVHYTLKRQLVEIQAVAHIIVGRNRFRIIIYHYRLIAKFATCRCSIYRTPVKLYRRTYAVRTRTKHNYVVARIHVVRYRVCVSPVSNIQVVCQVRIFRSYSIDTAHLGRYAKTFAVVAYAQYVGFHGAFRIFYQACNLEVGETKALRLGHHFLIYIGY